VAIIQILLIPIAFISVGLFVAWIFRRRARATQSAEIELEYTRAGINVRTSWVHGGRVASGVLQGVRFVLTIAPPTRSPPHAMLTTPSALGGTFRVGREGSADRFFKRLGLTSEMQIGDAGFDREFYLSGSRECLESLFGKAQARDAVRALFRLGFDSVWLRGGKLSALMPDCTPLFHLDTLRAALEQLTAIRTTPGAQAATMKEDPAPRTTQILYGSLTLLSAGYVLFLTADMMIQPLADGVAAVIEDAWPGALAAYLALAALVVFLLRGRPRAHYELFCILLMALPGSGLASWGGALLANQFLDQSAPRERLTRVEGSSGSRRSKWKFAVALAPWDASGRSVYIGSNLNGHPGQRWIVRTRSGRLGYEWVESAQPAPDI
jgi:hypothetical protein